jgi:predicted O-methyltransferase YrrM
MQLTKPVDWVSETKFIVDGLEFAGDLATYAERTTPERVVILKDVGLLQQYLEFFAPHSTGNILELGIWQGGSPLFYGLATDARKVVALDVKSPKPPALDEIIAQHRLADRVKLHFGVSQDDREKVSAIIDEEFGDEPIDLVIDDASHQYGFSRRAFEIIFPRLRPGGLYVIEDWQWAHIDSPAYQNGEVFGGDPALTNFIFELLVVFGGHPGLFEEIVMRSWFVAVKRARDPIAPDFRLDDLLRMRGKSLTLI